MTFKLTRKGQVVTTGNGPTQCKVQGWPGYNYKVNVWSSTLDDRGFVADNLDINATCEEVIKLHASESCERIAQACIHHGR